MFTTYNDQVRPADTRADVDKEAYVPVYARAAVRYSNTPTKTWSILAPLSLLVIASAAAAVLIQPAAPAEPAVPFAPLAAQLAASEVSPLNVQAIPMETPAGLATAAPIPPSGVASMESRAAPAPLPRPW